MKNTSYQIRRITTLALLIAVVLLMSYTPLGYLNIGPLSMSLLTIPVAIAAIVMGPIDGAIIGTVFGMTSFLNAMQGKSALTGAMFTLNPFQCFIVCVIARTLMGLCSGLIFKLLKERQEEKGKTNALITGLSASLLNTAFFMGTLVLFFYQSDYVQNLVNALHVNNPISFIVALVGVQGLIEAVVCALVASAVSVPLLKIRH